MTSERHGIKLKYALKLLKVRPCDPVNLHTYSGAKLYGVVDLEGEYAVVSNYTKPDGVKRLFHAVVRIDDIEYVTRNEKIDDSDEQYVVIQ